MDRDAAVKILARLNAEYPHQPLDPVQVQGEVRAYLLQRGRHVAHDMDLGPASDEYLIDLGQLDVMAQHDDPLPPGAAVALEMIVDQRLRESTYPTTGCSGCDLGTARHWPCTRPDEAGTYPWISRTRDHDRVLLQDQDEARGHETPTPEAAGSSAPTAAGQGQDATVARAGRKPRRNKRNIMDEAMDDLHFQDEE